MNTKNDDEIVEYTEKAMEILSHGDPIAEHVAYSQNRLSSDGKVSRALTLIAYSAFMDAADRIHCDITGSPQSGKTSTTESVLDTFPEDSIKKYTEVSEKHLYYVAEKENLDNTIIYLDDVQEKHIPLLKTFRNDGSTSPLHGTVVEGTAKELKVNGRPVIIGSSVMPLRDLEQQATSRVFLISIPDASPEEESAVHKKIISRISYGALFRSETDEQLYVLREMARILRDEGIDQVIVPFDVNEPDGADRRGTGQFMRLIKVSAFINQFQRPILKFNNDSKYVLATYDDLENAAQIWFSFGLSQQFKINDKALTILGWLLPSEGGALEATHLQRITKFGQRTLNRCLIDLYEAGLIHRKAIKAPGNPYVYWTSEEISQKMMSEIPASGEGQTHLGQIKTNSSCLKYMAENSSDSKISSIYELFFNSDKIDRKSIVRENGGCFIREYLSHFAENMSKKEIESKDSEQLGHANLAEMSEILQDCDFQVMAAMT